jgi:hypothetical protein
VDRQLRDVLAMAGADVGRAQEDLQADHDDRGET